MNKIIIGFIIALIIVGGGAFYGGMKYGQNNAVSKNAVGQGGQFSRAGGQSRGGNRTVGGFINGDIIAQDAQSITVQLQAGGSKIVFLSGSTQIMKSVDGSIADLTTGKNVMVTGTANADGSVTAQTIQLRPARPAETATSTPQK
jgi:hypothetical protein